MFIASPVLTAWKEREPGYIRRRQRIAEVEGGFVPAFADDVQVTRLADDDETEEEIAADIEREAPAAEAPAGSRRRLGRGQVAEAEAPEVAAEQQGVEAPEAEEAPAAPSASQTDKAPAPASRGNGAAANPESAERRKRNEERRAKRAQRRKGKRR
jgi:SecD/SecF fusion protein